MNVRFGAEIAAAATAHRLEPRLLAAVAAQETGGPSSNSGRNIVGDGGHGRGVFQIDDRSWAFAKTPAAMNPARNAEMAACILGDNLRRYGGDVRAALSAYNTGSPTARGTETTWGDGATLGYADSVLRHYGALGGDTQATLVGDKRETASSVNALAAYEAARPFPASFSPAPSAFSGSSLTALLLDSAQRPLPPVVPNPPAPPVGASDAAGADADSRMASIVTGDDPADDDGDAVAEA